MSFRKVLFCLTAQERSTMGLDSEQKHRDNPHTPYSLLEGFLSVEDCNNLRMCYPIVDAKPLYWGEEFFRGKQSLEPLDLDPNSPTYGQTLRDNALVRVEDLGSELDWSDRFPFKREPKPRVELEDTKSPEAK